MVEGREDDPGRPGSAAVAAGRGLTRRLVDGVLFVLSLIILAGWGAQGFYNLAPGESAVILRLGAPDRIRTVEGLWAHLPPPLESHVIVNSGELRTESFGTNPTRSTPGVPADADEGRVAEGIRRSAIQTADHNVVHVDYELQYKIADAHAFSFSMADPASILHDATEAAMRDVIGKREIDAVLTQDKQRIGLEAENRLRQMLTDYGKAIGHVAAFEIQRINLVKAQAPTEVRDAFADVVSAGQDEKRSTLTAEGDAAEIVERARSQAAEIRERAEADRAARVVEARGEAARFESLLAAYRVAPEVTRQRLYLETMESILPGMEKVIVERDSVNLWSALPAAASPAASAPAAVPAPPTPPVAPAAAAAGEASIGERKP